MIVDTVLVGERSGGLNIGSWVVGSWGRSIGRGWWRGSVRSRCWDIRGRCWSVGSWHRSVGSRNWGIGSPEMRSIGQGGTEAQTSRGNEQLEHLELIFDSFHSLTSANDH